MGRTSTASGTLFRDGLGLMAGVFWDLGEA